MIPIKLQNIEYLKSNSTLKDSNPLYYSIINNWPDLVELFLKAKIYDSNQKDLFNYSALHFGIVCNAQPQTMQKLLELGCDPLQKTDAGFTAREIAITTNSNPEIIKLLEIYEKFQTAITLDDLSNLSKMNNQPRDPDLLRGASILMELKSNTPCQR
jgi:ankyrin repeat protein